MNIDMRMQDHEKLTLALMIILFLFFVFLYYKINSAPKIINYPSAGTEIIAFGDSLVYGTGTDNGGFVTDLEVMIDHDIVNLGVAGDTTTNALVRIDEVINRDKNPKIVLISLGGNDFIQRVPNRTAEQNFNKIISKIQNAGAMVVLLEVPGYRGLYKDLSELHETAYVSNILRGLITNPKYMSDGIHPNELGYEKIARKIEPLLERLLIE